MNLKYLLDFIHYNSQSILHTILITILSYVSLEIKKLYQAHIVEQTKKEVITKVCHAIKEFYPDKTKEEQLNLIITNSEQILNEKNIKMTPLELKIYILSTIHTIKGDE